MNMERLTQWFEAAVLTTIIVMVVCFALIVVGATATTMVNLQRASEPESVGNAIIVYQDGSYKVGRIHDEEAGVYCWLTSTEKAGGGIFCLDERSLSGPSEGGR